MPRPPARPRTGYPSDVSDEEWTFVVPYLTLSRDDSPQRHHELRAVFNAVRWLVRTGASWRMMPNDLPPWPVVYQQMPRWRRAGCFEALVQDLRVLLREQAGRAAQPTAMILDSRTVQSTPESGARAGYDGAKRRKGSKVHAAVDTLGHLLALRVTPADASDREQVAEVAAAVQAITDQHVTLGYVDQGYTGATAAEAARLWALSFGGRHSRLSLQPLDARTGLPPVRSSSQTVNDVTRVARSSSGECHVKAIQTNA